MRKRKFYTAAKTALLFTFVLVLTNSLIAQSVTKKEGSTTVVQAASQTQTVNAQQSGAWTVGIDAAKNAVRISNPETDPVVVKLVGTGSARKPFQTRVVVTIPAGYGVGFTNLNIPVGKRLVIENLSAVARFPQGIQGFMQFLTYFDNGDTVFDAQDLAYHRIALVEQGNFYGQITSTANHKVLVFADERVVGHNNLVVAVSFGVNGTMTQATQAELTFSGYMEDLPTVP